MIRFANPYFLWLFLLYVPLIVWYIMRHKNNNPTLQVSSTMPFARMGNSWKLYLKHFMFAVKLAAIGCLIIIICRPQTYDSWSTTETEGTDIVLAVDVSTSMLAKDFDPDRFNAAKEVALQFVAGRETDNIGVVIFAGESFTQVPLTLDKAVLMNYIQDIKIGTLQDGTAIGDGIATSINRIKNGKAKSKSIILLTDGSNNISIGSEASSAHIIYENRQNHSLRNGERTWIPFSPTVRQNTDIRRGSDLGRHSRAGTRGSRIGLFNSDLLPPE